METHICDLCGKEVGRYELTELLECYRTENVKDLCGSCHAEVSAMKLRIDTAMNQYRAGFLRRFINNLRNRKSTEYGRVSSVPNS